jgi:hypothetical protein
MILHTTRLQRLYAQVQDFAQVYRLYRQSHSRMYAARIAWGIAFRSLPF